MSKVVVREQLRMVENLVCGGDFFGCSLLLLLLVMLMVDDLPDYTLRAALLSFLKLRRTTNQRREIELYL